MKNETPILYPLTAAQRIHQFSLMYCPKKQLLNIGTSFIISDDIDFEVLKKAIYDVYNRLEALRIRFTTNENNEEVQYIAEKEERDIEFFDFSHWKEEDANNEMDKWTEVPFERHNSPMNRIVMISMPDGFKGLYLNVDHMTMDSSSIISLMTDIIEIYCHYKHNTPYPKPLASYTEQLKLDLEYEKGTSKAFEKDTKFWEDALKSSEPIFNYLTEAQKIETLKTRESNPNARAIRIHSNSVDARHSVFHLDKKASTEMMDFCKSVNIPMVCLLMLGLRSYTSKINNFQTDVSINSTVARRATLKEKKSGGTRIHFFPCRTIIDDDSSFVSAMSQIQEVQNNMFRHANYNSTDYLMKRMEYYKSQPGESYESISLTYQPMTLNTVDSHPEIADIKYKSRWHRNGVAAQPIYLTVMHQPADGGIDFYFEHQPDKATFDDLEKMYYYMCRIMFMGIQNPEMSIGEIIRTV